LLWGVAASTQHKPEALTLEITVGGAAVVTGIILFAMTL
jgi:hypothetical protein